MTTQATCSPICTTSNAFQKGDLVVYSDGSGYEYVVIVTRDQKDGETNFYGVVLVPNTINRIGDYDNFDRQRFTKFHGTVKLTST